jgi:hypothetical protein
VSKSGYGSNQRGVNWRSNQCNIIKAESGGFSCENNGAGAETAGGLAKWRPSAWQRIGYSGAVNGGISVAGNSGSALAYGVFIGMAMASAASAIS